MLRWLEKHESEPNENPPLGIILCAGKKQEQIELTFQDRIPEIGYPAGSQLPDEKSYPGGGEFTERGKLHPAGRELSEKGHPIGGKSISKVKGFHPDLGWSHYRALMRVENKNARSFYETEAARNRWNKRQLERQIHSFYYERLLKSRDKAGIW